ncbi:hypothetical protein [Actinokineospora pegani]|uniref:hypothetical protein n=1 Tax=Actinokineospora pegani TaxID=2654637 RepID=UPI0012EA7CF1|nr:hypothetical protein [Actinokineospora pegani]
MATEDLALAGLGCVVLILGLVRAMAPTELPALDLVVAAAGAWLVFGGAGGALSAPGAIAVGAVLLLGSAVSGVCARRATRT